MPGEQNPTPRLPLVVKVANRYASVTQDARLVNAYAEQGQSEELFVYKRPGLSQDTALAGAGQGLFNWLGDIYAVFGTSLYKNGVSIGTVDATGGVYTFSSTLGDTPKLVLQNGVKAYTYSVATGLVQETYTATIAVTGDTTSGSAVIINVTPNTTGMTANAGVSGTGIPVGSYIVSVDSASQITINVPATATAAGVSLTVQTVGFPATFVKGVAFLDTTTYIMTPDAKIYGSGLNDPTTWNPLNKILAQIEPDKGVFLSKQLVYVIAFKQWSTEVFYDAANNVGSPLAPVQGAKVSQGCWSAGSVQEIEGVLVWVSESKSGAVSVYKMEGLKAEPIATPPIERLLEGADRSVVWSWSFRWGGHKFYGVTSKVSNLTLVYDLSVGVWYQWTDTNGNYWPIVSATTKSDQSVLLQHESNGKIYVIGQETVLDDGAIIPVDIYTPNYDGGTKLKKFVNRMDFVGDRVAGSIIYVSCNDYDYDSTKWTQPREVDMSLERPNLINCGTFRRRALHISHRAPTKMRLEAVEQQIQLGTN